MGSGDQFIARLTWEACFGGSCEITERDGKIEMRGHTHSNGREVFGIRGRIGSRISKERRDTFFIEGILISEDGSWIVGEDLSKVLEELHLNDSYTPTF